MEETIENEEDITQFASVELNDMMIEGEQGEEILECKGDREDQAEVMFEEEMRRLRRIYVLGSSQKRLISSIISTIFFFKKEQDETYIGYRPLRPNWCRALGLLANNYERREFIKLELEDLEIENPPIHFDTFQPGKLFFLYYTLI